MSERRYPGNSHIIPLANCPLCGGQADFIEDEEICAWLAECCNCGLRLGEPNGYSSRLDLCNDWNRRHEDERNIITVQFDDENEARRAYDAIEKLLGEMGQIGFLSAKIG